MLGYICMKTPIPGSNDVDNSRGRVEENAQPFSAHTPSDHFPQTKHPPVPRRPAEAQDTYSPALTAPASAHSSPPLPSPFPHPPNQPRCPPISRVHDLRPANAARCSPGRAYVQYRGWRRAELGSPQSCSSRAAGAAGCSSAGDAAPAGKKTSAAAAGDWTCGGACVRCGRP